MAVSATSTGETAVNNKICCVAQERQSSNTSFLVLEQLADSHSCASYRCRQICKDSELSLYFCQGEVSDKQLTTLPLVVTFKVEVNAMPVNFKSYYLYHIWLKQRPNSTLQVYQQKKQLVLRSGTQGGDPIAGLLWLRENVYQAEKTSDVQSRHGLPDKIQHLTFDNVSLSKLKMLTTFCERKNEEQAFLISKLVNKIAQKQSSYHEFLLFDDLKGKVSLNAIQIYVDCKTEQARILLMIANMVNLANALVNLLSKGDNRELLVLEDKVAQLLYMEAYWVVKSLSRHVVVNRKDSTDFSVQPAYIGFNVSKNTAFLTMMQKAAHGLYLWFCYWANINPDCSITRRLTPNIDSAMASSVFNSTPTRSLAVSLDQHMIEQVTLSAQLANASKLLLRDNPSALELLALARLLPRNEKQALESLVMVIVPENLELVEQVKALIMKESMFELCWRCTRPTEIVCGLFNEQDQTKVHQTLLWLAEQQLNIELLNTAGCKLSTFQTWLKYADKESVELKTAAMIENKDVTVKQNLSFQVWWLAFSRKHKSFPELIQRAITDFYLPTVSRSNHFSKQCSKDHNIDKTSAGLIAAHMYETCIGIGCDNSGQRHRVVALKCDHCNSPLLYVDYDDPQLTKVFENPFFHCFDHGFDMCESCSKKDDLRD